MIIKLTFKAATLHLDMLLLQSPVELGRVRRIRNYGEFHVDSLGDLINLLVKLLNSILLCIALNFYLPYLHLKSSFVAVKALLKLIVPLHEVLVLFPLNLQLSLLHLDSRSHLIICVL